MVKNHLGRERGGVSGKTSDADKILGILSLIQSIGREMDEPEHDGKAKEAARALTRGAAEARRVLGEKDVSE